MVKKWKSYFFNLTSDGILTRFTDENKKKTEATLDIKNCSILVAHDTFHLPDRPKLEQWMDEKLLMCIPFNKSLNWWLLFNNYSQLGQVKTNEFFLLKIVTKN